jgi:hypothetical protein
MTRLPANQNIRRCCPTSMALHRCVPSGDGRLKQAVIALQIAGMHRQADATSVPNTQPQPKMLPQPTAHLCFPRSTGKQSPEHGCTLRFKFTERLTQTRGPQDSLLPSILGRAFDPTFFNELNRYAVRVCQRGKEKGSAEEKEKGSN